MSHNSAIIGYGGMGSWHHRSIKEKVPEINVYGALDIREEAREKARAAGLFVYDSLDALLADKNIDIVTVATPNNFHKDYAIACLRAGKNVVCEKPVAMNAAELTEMISAARESNSLFTVHQNRRWDRDYRIVKKTLDDGVIGSPYFIESRVQGSRGAMYGWRGYKENGGGMALDWGVHLLDQLLYMIDSPVVSVYAHFVELFSVVDDNEHIILRFENGVMAHIEISTNCLILQPRWHVSASDGTLQIDDWSCRGKIVKLKADREMEWTDDIIYTEAGPTRTMAPRPSFTTEELPLPAVDTDWSDFYRNVAGVLDRGEELIVKPEQALRVMRVVDAVFESDREKRSVTVNI